ncbi:hypothetical protein ACRASX_11105 [Flavobacterium sp. TMP13]|uniref:hypothetical protein n=1 Tax=unclassified Flavobacterium TaxID=196869 RepID=UPI00076D1D0E|nr:hypothetical protein [Flavobacterium sp. TAB 87]KVV16122.1 hypothetical protein AP058_00287 [Flavobacterium sp. TAB 87]
MTRKERLTERNNQVRKMFYELHGKHKEWRVDAIIDKVGEKMFLASRTVEAILNYEGIYGDAPAPKSQLQLSL